MRLSAQTDRPSILQRPPYQNLTARESVERKGLVGRIVIGLGYQKVDEAFKAPTCLFSVHEGYEMTDPPLWFFTRASVSFDHDKQHNSHNTLTTWYLIHFGWKETTRQTEHGENVSAEFVILCSVFFFFFFLLVVEIFRRVSVGCYFKQASPFSIWSCVVTRGYGGLSRVCRDSLETRSSMLPPDTFPPIKQLILCNPHHAFGTEKATERDIIFGMVPK